MVMRVQTMQVNNPHSESLLGVDQFPLFDSFAEVFSDVVQAVPLSLELLDAAVHGQSRLTGEPLQNITH